MRTYGDGPWTGQEPTGKTGMQGVAAGGPQRHASVPQPRICLDKWPRCTAEREVSDQTFYLIQSQYTDTVPTSPDADPKTPGAPHCCHWSISFSVTGMTRPGKRPTTQAGIEPRPAALEADALPLGKRGCGAVVVG